MKTHWHTIGLDFKSKTVYVGDGFNSVSTITDKAILSLITDILYVFTITDKKQVLKLLMEWKIIRCNKIILQNDSVSCGPIAIIFLILILSRCINTAILNPETVRIKNELMISFRIKIATSILVKKSFFAHDFLLTLKTLNRQTMDLFNKTIKSKIEELKAFNGQNKGSIINL